MIFPTKSIQFLQEEHLENTHFPIQIEYTDSGERVWIDAPEDIDGGRHFKVLHAND